MELPRPAIIGIIAVVVLLVGALGYSMLRSSDTLSAGEEKERMQQIDQQYRTSMQSGGGPSIYTNPKQNNMPAGTSTSASGGPSIYK